MTVAGHIKIRMVGGGGGKGMGAGIGSGGPGTVTYTVGCGGGGGVGHAADQQAKEPYALVSEDFIDWFLKEKEEGK